MTEQQKKLVAEIRKNAEELKFMSALWRFRGYGNAIMDINCILDAVDAMEADGKCEYVQYFTSTQRYCDRFKCDKCGDDASRNDLTLRKFCPGCGREIEAAE